MKIAKKNCLNFKTCWFSQKKMKSSKWPLLLKRWNWGEEQIVTPTNKLHIGKHIDNSPLVQREIESAPTDAAPASSPQTVTRAGFPPNGTMLSRIHNSAARWSQSPVWVEIKYCCKFLFQIAPKFPGNRRSPFERKPKNVSRWPYIFVEIKFIKKIATFILCWWKSY